MMETLNLLMGYAVCAWFVLGFALMVFELLFEFALWLRGDYDYDDGVSVGPDAGGSREDPQV